VGCHPVTVAARIHSPMATVSASMQSEWGAGAVGCHDLGMLCALERLTCRVGRAVSKPGLYCCRWAGPVASFPILNNFPINFQSSEFKNTKHDFLIPKISKLGNLVDKFKWNTFPFWIDFLIPLDFELYNLEANPI
jgi:hypothetical protein